MTVNDPEKIEWQGTIISIQPRTTVWRYRLDNRTHYHRGLVLVIICRKCRDFERLRRKGSLR